MALKPIVNTVPKLYATLPIIKLKQTVKTAIPQPVLKYFIKYILRILLSSTNSENKFNFTAVY